MLSLVDLGTYITAIYCGNIIIVILVPLSSAYCIPGTAFSASLDTVTSDPHVSLRGRGSCIL